MMTQRLHALVHLPKERFVLREPAFAFVHVRAQRRNGARSFGLARGV